MYFFFIKLFVGRALSVPQSREEYQALFITRILNNQGGTMSATCGFVFFFLC